MINNQLILTLLTLVLKKAFLVKNKLPLLNNFCKYITKLFYCLAFRGLNYNKIGTPLIQLFLNNVIVNLNFKSQ